VIGSFRDPAGYVFFVGERPHRFVRRDFAEHYDHMIASGFYRAAVDRGLLIPHEEVELDGIPGGETPHRVLRPEPIPFVSYPYEWCPSQLKDAALLTLDLASLALRFGLMLKDASAYNVQFRGSRPVFVDTTSFVRVECPALWPAYHQFCKHFVAPLALARFTGDSACHELRVALDGMPLAATSRRLPWRSWLSLGTLTHLHLHAASERVARPNPGATGAGARASRERNLTAFLDHLRSVVGSLEMPCAASVWRDYERSTHYAEDSLAHKREAVEAALELIRPDSVWDLGANVGHYSRLCSERGIYTLSIDGDASAVELAYRRARAETAERVLPIRMDLTNPSPSLGWDHAERMSLAQRGPCDLALALALVHHLAIGAGIPLEQVASCFRHWATALLIEWVPPEDEKATELSGRRPDLSICYDESEFERCFSRHFEQVERFAIRGSKRALYLYRAKS